jgi:hypothetical protein
MKCQAMTKGKGTQPNQLGLTRRRRRRRFHLIFLSYRWRKKKSPERRVSLFLVLAQSTKTRSHTHICQDSSFSLPFSGMMGSRHLFARVRLLVVMLMMMMAMIVVVVVQGASGCLGPSVNEVPPKEINVAVLVWADSDEVILSRPISSYAPIPLTSTAYKTGVPTTLQPFYLGIDFYARRFAALRNNQLPVRGGAANISLTVSYVNMGRINWDNLVGGYPVDGIASVAAASRPGGLFDQLAYNSSSLLGANRTFTFIIPHPLLSTFVYGLLNRIEDQLLAILVHPFLSTATAFVCDGLPSAVSATPDCRSAPYDRDRIAGQRRFDTLISVLPDLSNDADTTLDFFYTVGIRRIAVIADAGEYSSLVYKKALEYADELNIKVLTSTMFSVLVSGQCPTVVDDTTLSDAFPHCPPPSQLLLSQNQVWPNGATALDWATQLQSLGVEGVIVIGTIGTGAGWSIGQLVGAMQAINWTPKMLSWVGAFEKSSLAAYLPHGKADMLHTTGEIVWNRNLRGAAFRPMNTPTNFELVEANTTHSAPAVFVDQFDAMYGPDCDPDLCVAPATPGVAHPYWNGNIDGGVIPTIAYASMMRVQKMVEASMSSDVSRILAATSSIDTPSTFYGLALDAFGRTRKFDVVVTQYAGVGVTDDTNIVSPFNIGVNPVYPMPTWSERVFEPAYYATTDERLMAGFTSACILVVLIVFIAVLVHMRRPVIRATTPSFALPITFGAVLMLASNYVGTLHTNSAQCAAQVWCLSLGLTLMLSALFVKTFRIWRIFQTQRLMVTVMRDSYLFKAVFGFVVVDLAINAVWQGMGGMHAVLIVVDPVRPSYNYWTCDYTSGVGMGGAYAQLVYKLLIILGGICLTWAVRNVPSTFNESKMLTACIYNILLVSCFVVPLVASGVGGRTTTFLVRSFAVMFVSVSTSLMLYAPKLYSIWTGADSRMQKINDTQQGATHTSNNTTTNNPHTHEKRTTKACTSPPSPSQPLPLVKVRTAIRISSGISKPTTPKTMALATPLRYQVVESDVSMPGALLEYPDAGGDEHLRDSSPA